MPDIAGVTQSPSAPGTNMYDTTDATTPNTYVPTEVSERFQTVCLSGPIKILLPISTCEETENLNCQSRDLHFDASASIEVGANIVGNTNKEIVQLSHLIDTKVPVDTVSDIIHMDSASKTKSTKNLSPTMDKNSPAAEQSDRDDPKETVSPFCPFILGNEIVLNTPDGDAQIKAVIIKTFPATLSCCMVIRFVEPAIFDGISECVLKLYDRRFSTQLRSDFKASTWTPELEKDYQNFVACGDAEEFFSYWDAELERDHDWLARYINNFDRWNAAKREAYLQWKSIDSYETEKKAYEDMADLQGVDVPRVFGEVLLKQPAKFQGQGATDAAGVTQGNSTSTTTCDDETNPDIVNIPGILIQYVDGFLLSEPPKHLPQDNWQSIADRALEIFNRVQGCGIFNSDAAVRSFIVNPMTHKVMMIDFGMVIFREVIDDDKEWEVYLSHPSQEERLAMNIKIHLNRNVGVKIDFRPSEEYWRLKYRHPDMFGQVEGLIEGEEEDEYVERYKGSVACAWVE